MPQVENGNPQPRNLEKENINGLNSPSGYLTNHEKVTYRNSVFMFLKIDLTVKATNPFS